MDMPQVRERLLEVFADPHTRIVFWSDADEEFRSILPDLELPEVTVVDLATVPSLGLKIRLERQEPTGRFLLYQAGEEPDYDRDWLLDIRLYSRPFRADRASILLGELGLERQAMRPHLAARRKFFDSKERLRRVKSFVSPNDDELALDLAMIAVVAKAEQADFPAVVRTLFHTMAEVEDFELEVVPEVWEQLEKFELDAAFWDLAKQHFGYGEDSPSLRNLLLRLFVSDFLTQRRGETPAAFANLQLPATGCRNAAICLAQWRESSSKAPSYGRLAGEVAARLHLADHLLLLQAEELAEVMTFAEVERAIVSSLLPRIGREHALADSVAIRAITDRRLAGHWVTSASVPESQRQARASTYEALGAAAELFELRARYADGFVYPDAAAMYRAYEQELYKFDQLYRQFCWHADRAAGAGWDLLKELGEGVERLYRNGYLVDLGLAWGRFVEGGLLETWKLPEVRNQYEFYEEQVARPLRRSDRKRIWVVISDAMRYEVAAELEARLRGTDRLDAELSSQLGVLPSYTALGMASLLPHQQLAYSGTDVVLIDGKRTARFAEREAILAKAGAKAIKFEDLIKLKKGDGRELVGDARVVFVYHNEIDGRGDNQPSESGAFDAAQHAIEELADLVRHIVNNLNGNQVLITADHGFLFTVSAPDELDKSQLGPQPPGTVKAKQRYLLGRDLPQHSLVWHGQCAVSARAEGGMEFWLPKGANRFSFSGGARYVHGGAMLQEIVVPIITVTHAKGKAVAATRTRFVAVLARYTPIKITTAKHRFQLMQTEAVSDRVKPITVKAAVYDGTEAVSTTEIVRFDKGEGTIEEWTHSVVVTLADRPFDKATVYHLVLHDSDTGIEHYRCAVSIDRVINDDF